MHIPDLELCQYHSGPLDAESWKTPLLAVGWLEHPHKFPTGDTPGAFAVKLESLVSQTRSVFSQYTFRGVADCTFCQAAGAASPGPIWSQENIIVPGDGEVYASPGGIVHYVAAHQYRPPVSFVEAVLRCPPCGSSEYFEAIRKANAGVAPPIEANSDCLARLKQEFAVSRAGLDK